MDRKNGVRGQKVVLPQYNSLSRDRKIRVQGQKVVLPQYNSFSMNRKIGVQGLKSFSLTIKLKIILPGQRYSNTGNKIMLPKPRFKHSDKIIISCTNISINEQQGSTRSIVSYR